MFLFKSTSKLVPVALTFALVLSACSVFGGDDDEASSDTTAANETDGSTGADDTTPVTPDPDALVGSILTRPIPCDGAAHPAMKVTNFEPNEGITFVGENGGESLTIPPANADAAGEYTLNFTCPTGWDKANFSIRATGDTSGQTVSANLEATLDGAAAPAAEDPAATAAP